MQVQKRILGTLILFLVLQLSFLENINLNLLLHCFISIINFSNCYFGYMSDSEESFNSEITDCVFFRHSSCLLSQVVDFQASYFLASLGHRCIFLLQQHLLPFLAFLCFFPTSSVGSTFDCKTQALPMVVTSFLHSFFYSVLTGEHMKSHGFIYHFLFYYFNLPLLS